MQQGEYNRMVIDHEVILKNGLTQRMAAVEKEMRGVRRTFTGLLVSMIVALLGGIGGVLLLYVQQGSIRESLFNVRDSLIRHMEATSDERGGQVQGGGRGSLYLPHSVPERGAVHEPVRADEAAPRR